LGEGRDVGNFLVSQPLSDQKIKPGSLKKKMKPRFIWKENGNREREGGLPDLFGNSSMP